MATTLTVNGSVTLDEISGLAEQRNRARFRRQ